MSNFESVKKFMKTFGQEVKEKAEFPTDKITSGSFFLAPKIHERCFIFLPNLSMLCMCNSFTFPSSISLFI